MAKAVKKNFFEIIRNQEKNRLHVTTNHAVITVTVQNHEYNQFLHAYIILFIRGCSKPLQSLVLVNHSIQ